jgi:hypothetical protein
VDEEQYASKHRDDKTPERLPIDDYKDEILQRISSDRVTVR